MLILKQKNLLKIDKIIRTNNDYSEKLYNGLTGIIKNIYNSENITYIKIERDDKTNDYIENDKAKYYTIYRYLCIYNVSALFLFIYLFIYLF